MSVEECIIYFACLKDGSGQGYVGKTNRSIAERKAEHEQNAKQGCPGLFYDALRNEGIKNWEWEFLEICPADQAYERERFFIEKLKAGVSRICLKRQILDQ